MPKEEWDTIEEYLLYLRSLAAYMFARGFVDNKLVLEVGCGAGYGANDIARFASSIIAVDISGEAISYAQGKYSKASLIFAQANGNKLGNVKPIIPELFSNPFKKTKANR